MGSQSDAINDSVTGIPPATRTRTIKQHFNPESDARGSGIKTARTRELIEGENRERGWHNPTVRVWHPWPTELVRIKADVSVGRAKFPFPQPTRFLSGGVHEPGEALQLFRNNFKFVMKGDEHKSRNPCAFLVITREHRPASV